jgi:hypothetical protein
MSIWYWHTWSSSSANGLVTDKEVQVLGPPLRTQVTARPSSTGEERRLVCDGWSS